MIRVAASITFCRPEQVSDAEFAWNFRPGFTTLTGADKQDIRSQVLKLLEDFFEQIDVAYISTPVKEPETNEKTLSVGDV